MVFKKIALFWIFGIFLTTGFAAQENPAADPHSTGLIPLDADQMKDILTSWPRITGVNLNWLGYERILKVKAEKGKTLLGVGIKSAGQELESSIDPSGAFVQAAGFHPALVGDLPLSVDNSALKYFPPIRTQGSLGSCVSFAIAYYQLSYMAAFQRDLDIRDDNDNTNKYSPKWAFNMVNGGSNDGSSFSANYSLLQNHGAATWAEFPYDGDYLAWCPSATAWRNALSIRTRTVQYVYDVSSDSGLELVKGLLVNGYVVVFGTYINSWQYKTVQNDPSTSEDDAAVGQSIGYWLNGTEGSHTMTIVGYNDAIWTDINGNEVIDQGEKGAFRIANSWGSSWRDGGFVWLAYDALRNPSDVPDWSSTGRVAALQNDLAFVLTVRDGYSPWMIAEFTVNHAKRNQLRMSLGRSDTSVTLPSTAWYPSAINNQGGAFAFDGSKTAIDGTFILDFTDIFSPGDGPQRYYLGMSDSAAGDAATLTAFKIIDLTTSPETEAVSALVPQSADGGPPVYAYVDYAWGGLNPVPHLTSLSPVKASAGSGFTLILSGSDFVPGSFVTWNGKSVATTYIVDTELQANISGLDCATGGEYQVTVVNPSPGGGVSEAVVFPVSTFVMASPTASATINAGQSASYIVELTPQFGSFDSAVFFSCTDLPKRCTASFSPGSVVPGAAIATTTMTLTTKSSQGSAAGTTARTSGFPPPDPGVLFSLLALLLWLRFRGSFSGRPLRRRLSAAMIVCFIVMLAGCSAGGDGTKPSSNGTPPGTYQVTVRGVSGRLTVSTTVTLVVN